MKVKIKDIDVLRKEFHGIPWAIVDIAGMVINTKLDKRGFHYFDNTFIANIYIEKLLNYNLPDGDVFKNHGQEVPTNKEFTFSDFNFYLGESGILFPRLKNSKSDKMLKDQEIEQIKIKND